MVQSELVRRMSGPARTPQYQRTPVRPPHLAQRPKQSDLWRFTVKPEEEEDVIDLGAPRAVRADRQLGPARARVGRAYTPNPRLYPGLPKPAPIKLKRKPSSQRSRRNKNTFRRPVPNSRLYRPGPQRPRRPPPPPANPRTVWQPPQTDQPLETASRAALRLTQCAWLPQEHKARASSPQRALVRKRSRKRVIVRRKSPVRSRSPGPCPAPRRSLTPELPPKLLIRLPAAAGDGDSSRGPEPRYRPASLHFRSRALSTPSDSTPTGARAVPLPIERIMDAARHSTSPEDCSEGNDSHSAPSEFLAEFLSAIMRRQYAEALKYCRLILQYEPRNATARGFYPLLQQKLAQQSPRAHAHRPHAHAHSPQAHAHSPHAHAHSPQAHALSPSHSWASARQRRHARATHSPTDLGGTSSGNSGESSPVEQTPCFIPEVMELDADSLSGSEASGRPGSASSAGEPEPGLGSVSSQSSLELDSSDANARSTPSLSLSRRTDHTDRTDSGSASASGTWDSSGSARDDNGNPAPAPCTPPLSCACDADNNTAAPARSPQHRSRPLTLQSEQSSESLARLRAQFTCSIK